MFTRTHFPDLQHLATKLADEKKNIIKEQLICPTLSHRVFFKLNNRNMDFVLNKSWNEVGMSIVHLSSSGGGNNQACKQTRQKSPLAHCLNLWNECLYHTTLA